MTDHERELLTMLAEEANEVAIACTKALRHGLDSHHPDRPHQNNFSDIRKELSDVGAVVALLKESGLDFDPTTQEIYWAVKKKRHWMHTKKESNQ